MQGKSEEDRAAEMCELTTSPIPCPLTLLEGESRRAVSEAESGKKGG